MDKLQDPLEHYNFKDDHGHSLKMCVDYQNLLKSHDHLMRVLDMALKHIGAGHSLLDAGIPALLEAEAAKMGQEVDGQSAP